MVTLVKRKSWKAVMDSGRDPRGVHFLQYRVDGLLVIVTDGSGLVKN